MVGFTAHGVTVSSGRNGGLEIADATRSRNEAIDFCPSLEFGC
jgi:hypothetical protein